MKTGWLQLIEHHHTGRLRQHHHTSFAGLAFVLLIIGVLLTAASLAEAATPAVNPQSGSVGLSGTVRGPAPTTSAVITNPRSGQRTSTIPITISGTCPQGTFVQITKNDTFAGATDCAEGIFSLQIDLFDGANRLIARVSDALDQFGPDSAPVDIFYDAPSLAIPGGAIGRQLFLQTNTTVVASSPGIPISRGATIVGGFGPYAISFDWGDGATSLISQTVEGPVSAAHTYERPGNYRVIMRVTDSTGNSAFLQIITVINGPTEPIGATGGNGLGALPGSLITAWPLYIMALIMVGFFWLGQFIEIRKLRRKRRLIESV